MKLFVRTMMAVAGLMVAATGALSAQQTGQIVFIDSQRLRQEAPGLQEARQQLQQEMARFEAHADSALAPLQQQLQEMATSFQQQQSMMTPETRQQQQQALAAKQQEIQQRGQELEQQAAARQNEILGPALERINQVIDQLRQDRGYAYILDVAAGGVIAADSSLDITAEVLNRLNAVANQGS